MNKRKDSVPETDPGRNIHFREGTLSAEPGLRCPSSFEQGFLYSIYPRAFSNEGTLDAVLPHLDRLVNLGACGLWFLPLHPVGLLARKGSLGSPYSIRNYQELDPAYGTVEGFARLVQEAHDRGLKVILDFVANHAAHDHHLLSSHPEYFHHDDQGHPTQRVSDWSDIVDWNFESPEVSDYLIQSGSFWMREVGLDGFRCDVAGMVPLKFWNRFREAIAEVHPEPFLLAEWQDALHHVSAFNASYDWHVFRTMREVAQGKASLSTLEQSFTDWTTNFPKRAIPLRFLENHDENRVMSYLNAKRLPAYAAVAFLSGGLPLIYNGQEIGAKHRPSLFEADPIPWEADYDPKVERTYQSIFELARDPLWGVGNDTVPFQLEGAFGIRRSREGALGVLLANMGTSPIQLTRPEPDRSWSVLLGPEEERFDLLPGEVWIGRSDR
ncbi:MAG: alpha-amylase [Candidatus Eisenbacteria bacterium]|uniref:Alpha-amylase n=1 Tax=Eiseniibacteriota bacterium TaxID=2212470 RepID=A0A7Y2EDB6_UNCEI|nr:alpha-amylase [Candidatus Eisenbacteria bacterium]